jgi:hypothetical protein
MPQLTPVPDIQEASGNGNVSLDAESMEMMHFVGLAPLGKTGQ